MASTSSNHVTQNQAVSQWLSLVYAGDIAGGMNRAQPAAAARLLEESPGLLDDDPFLGCATGDEALLRRTIESDPCWVHRAGGPLALPPLVAVTHSSLVRLPAFCERLRACARLLIEAGADPNQSVGSRWPPASLAAPSATDRLSALYGAAGQNHDPEMTRLLLAAGADPNDGESLYHSLESIACTRLLLEAGTKITGTNALYRVLDFDALDALQLLLSHGADPNEPGGNPSIGDGCTPILWAIRRRRSPAHIKALLAAGADPAAKTKDGTSAFTLASRFGLPEVAELLRDAGAGEDLSPQEAFVAACARADEAAARRIRATHPEVIGMLSEAQLRVLPELAAQPCGEAVQLMVELGWPVAMPGGDWNASALNQAVFRGDAPLARFLLGHGARWSEQHGHGDNVLGTLSWASRNEPVDGGDWPGCAQALMDHDMPTASPDPESAGSVIVDGRRMWFSDGVTELLLSGVRGEGPSRPAGHEPPGSPPT